MAWNTPGGSSPGGSGDNSGDSGGPRQPRRPDGGGGLPPVIRDLLNNSGSFWRWWGLLVLVLALVFSSFQLIGEQQRGVVLRFGQFARIMQPGPNFKWPWPVESVIKVNATQIKTFSNTVPVLTRDENIVNVTMNVQYRVGDPHLYLFGSVMADRVLEQAAQSVVREQVGRSDLDTVLGARGPLSASAMEQLQASLDSYKTGLLVTELNLQDARPPEEVKPAFDEVNSAQQIKDQSINEARAYAARIVPEARGEASMRRTIATGYKTAKIANAEGDVARFSLLRDEYRNAPDITRKRLWLETVQEVMSHNRKVVGGDGRQLIYVPMAGSPVPEASSSAPLLTPSMLTPSAGAAAGAGTVESVRSGSRDAQRSASREEANR